MARFSRTELHYEIVGNTGPWVALLQGGRQPLTELKGFALSVADRGYRVILHDYRNCGRSSIDFDSKEPEEDIWAADLNALLDHLDAQPAIVVGRSRGARIAVRLALDYPRAVRGLFLWGLSGGTTAIRFLDEYYYRRYLRAAQTGGMEAVCALDHFAALLTARPENRRLLLDMPVEKFITVMSRWRNSFLIGADLTVMGLRDEELRQIRVPTAIVPYYDKVHSHAAVNHAHQMILNSTFFDFEPRRRDAPKCDSEMDARDQITVAAILCSFFYCQRHAYTAAIDTATPAPAVPFRSNSACPPGASRGRSADGGEDRLGR